MSNEFFTRKSRQTFFGLFCDITTQQIKDSALAYLNVFVIALLVEGYLIYLSFIDDQRFLSACKYILDFNHELYVLMPPFVIAVIALFPSFSSQTKEKLREIKNGRPRVAPFLEQFLFLVFLSLGLYLSSKLAGTFFDGLTSKGPGDLISADLCFWILCFMALFICVGLAFLFETFHSLKILYILVIREYFI